MRFQGLRLVTDLVAFVVLLPLLFIVLVIIVGAFACDGGSIAARWHNARHAGRKG